jgi:hypothetical protein
MKFLNESVCVINAIITELNFFIPIKNSSLNFKRSTRVKYCSLQTRLFHMNGVLAISTNSSCLCYFKFELCKHGRIRRNCMKMKICKWPLWLWWRSLA